MTQEAFKFTGVKNKIFKLILVCIICLALITGAVLLVQRIFS